MSLDLSKVNIPQPIIAGRWVDAGPTGQSLVEVPSAVTLPTGGEWYLSGGVTTDVADLADSDWTGPVTVTDGSTNPVLMFTVKSLNGAALDRYTHYYYTVGIREIGAPGNKTVSPVSNGAYPTNGWPSGTVLIPTTFQNASDKMQTYLTWDALPASQTDFSKTYVVQRALGTKDTGTTYAYGSSEQDALTANGIKDFYAYAETTETQVQVKVLDDDPTHWTWFRVMAYSKLWGYTGVYQSGSTSTNWIAVPNDKSKYVVDSKTGDVVVGEPTDTSSGTGTVTVKEPVSAATLPIETNLPMLKTGIGGITHAHAPATPDGAQDKAHMPVRWRDGMLVLNADQTVSMSQTNRRWGFRFHYNPSTWSQSSAIAQGIDLTTYAQTGGNLLLPTTFSDVSLTVYLNRIVELSLDVPPDDPDGVDRRVKQLASDDFFMGSADGAPQANVNPIDSGIVMSIDPAARATTVTGTTVADKVRDLLQKGTLADIEYLYRACNGNPVPVSHTSGETADIGMLGMTLLDLYLGPNIKYTVRVASANIQHMMFNNRMIPIFSQVQLTLLRGITMKDKGSVSTTTYGADMTKYINDQASGSTP